MIRVENEHFLYVKFNEKKSNLSMIFEKEKKQKYDKKLEEYVESDESYKKYVNEYFAFTSLTDVIPQQETKKVMVGNTLISILNNKKELEFLFSKYAEQFIKADEGKGIDYLKNLISILSKTLININQNYIIFTFLLECIICELNLEDKQKFKKIKTSIAIFLTDLVSQIGEIEDFINILFLDFKNDNIDNIQKSFIENYSRKTYHNSFIVPETINTYILYKYFPKIIKTEYLINNIIDLTYCTIYILSHNEKGISKCKCCQKYFIPHNRNDTLNCSKKCANKNRKDALEKDYKTIIKIYNRIAIYLKRHRKIEMFKTFKTRYHKKKEDFKNLYGNSEKYIQKLTEWLLYYENKHIKKNI